MPFPPCEWFGFCFWTCFGFYILCSCFFSLQVILISEFGYSFFDDLDSIWPRQEWFSVLNYLSQPNCLSTLIWVSSASEINSLSSCNPLRLCPASSPSMTERSTSTPEVDCQTVNRSTSLDSSRIQLQIGSVSPALTQRRIFVFFHTWHMLTK